jgi:hypothetical protein
MRSMELVGRERMEVAVSIRSTSFLIFAVLKLTSSSNNSPSGVNHVTMMYRMSRTSLVYCYMKSVNSRINMLIVTTNIVSLSRASEISKLLFSQVETVSTTLYQRQQQC